MGEMSVLFNQVLALFVMLGIGYCAVRFRLLSDSVIGGVNLLVWNVTLPCLVIASFQMDVSADLIGNMLWVFAGALVAHALSFGVGVLAFVRAPREQKGLFRFVTVFPNAAYMGLPIMLLLFGPTAAIYSAVFGVVHGLYMYTLGVSCFSGRVEQSRPRALRRILINPGFISTLIGLLLFGLRVRLPSVAIDSLQAIGGTTTPLAMMMVGARLATVDLKSILRGRWLYFVSAVRLLVMAPLIFGLCRLLHIPELPTGILTVTAAMPAAASTVLFAEIHGGDAQLASRLVFITTALSMCTIPLAILMLRTWG